jgi:tetratricopeptide (TPR) repeat protein
MPGARDRPVELADALEAAGGVAYWQGDMDSAQAFYDESLALVRTQRDQRKFANALYNDAFPKLVSRRDLAGGLSLVNEALPFYRALNDDIGLARCLWAIGNVLHFQERYVEAIVPMDEAIGLFRRLGDRFSLGWALHTRTLIAVKLDDLATGRASVREGLMIFSEAGDVSGMALLVDDAAYIIELKGLASEAFRLAGAAAASQASLGAGIGVLASVEEGRNWHDSIASEEHKRAWAEGQAMTLEQAVAYALALDRTSEAETPHDHRSTVSKHG